MSSTHLFTARKASQGSRGIADHLSEDDGDEYVPSGEDERRSESSFNGADDDNDNDLRDLNGEEARRAVEDMVKNAAMIFYFTLTVLL